MATGTGKAAIIAGMKGAGTGAGKAVNGIVVNGRQKAMDGDGAGDTGNEMKIGLKFNAAV